MLLRLSSPADSDIGPERMERVFAAMHQANQRRIPFALEFARYNDTVSPFLRFPRELRPFVETPIAANYQHASLQRLHDEALDCPEEHTAWSMTMRLKPDLFPIIRSSEVEHDPLVDLLGALSCSRHDPTHSKIVLHVQPHPTRSLRRRTLRRAIRVLDRPLFRRSDLLTDFYKSAVTGTSRTQRLLAWAVGFFVPTGSLTQKIDTSQQQGHSQEDVLQAANLKLGSHLFEVHLHVIVYAPNSAKRKAYSKLYELFGALGPFTSPMLATFDLSRVREGEPKIGKRGFLLSNEELASLFHPATISVQTRQIQKVAYRELEPPIDLPTSEREEGFCELGQTAFANDAQRFGMLLNDRRRHIAIVGKTGMGKSTLLRRMIESDMNRGRGVGLIDPHGDLAESILQSIPTHRTNDVIYFDAGDKRQPLGYNPLKCRSQDQRLHVASAVVTSFKKVFGNSWGPRLENILRNAILAVLELPDPTLSDVMRLLTEKAVRKTVTAKLQNPEVKRFFVTRFDVWNDRFREEAIEPVLNKVGQFLSSPLVNKIVETKNAKLDLRSAMDDGQILIINLSKGRVGEDNAQLLGAFFVTGLQQAAMSRADTPEDDRQDFFAYIDEFQNFATDSFEDILSEARKYRLSLTLANQYLAQMEKDGNQGVKQAVFGNVGSLISFQVGSDDGEELAKQLSKYEDQVTATDLISLPKYKAYSKLLIDGMPSQPFSMTTLAPTKRDPQRGEKIRKHSRQRYGIQSAA